MVRKIFSTIILLILFSNTSLFSKTSKNIEVYLKNNKVTNGKVSEILPWGILLKTDQTISYKIISKIIVYDESIIDSLGKHVQELKFTHENNKIVIDFSNAVFQKFSIKDSYILEDKFFIISLMSNRAENFDFSLYFSTKVLKKLLFRLSYSTGRYSNKIIYSINAYNIGIGTKIKFPFGNFIPSLNYGVKSVAFSEKRYISTGIATRLKESIFINLNFSRKLFTDSYFFTIGSRYYFKNVTVKESNTKFGFDLGLGIIF